MTKHIEELNPYQIRRVLLLASRYDAYLLEEDGSMEDYIANLYKERELGYTPQFVKAYDRKTTLQIMQESSPDILIVCIRKITSENHLFLQTIQNKYPSIPIVLLLYNEISQEEAEEKCSDISVDLFLWNGESRIIASILELIEDKKNVFHDSALLPIPIILFVEDNMQYYSSYLNILYKTLWHETKKLYQDHTSLQKKTFQQKTRTKVLHAKTYEEAIQILDQYHQQIIGVITDMQYPMKEGRFDTSGLYLAKKIWEYNPVLPIILQSSTTCLASCIKEHPVVCIQKTSKTLLSDIKNTLTAYFGFGDLNFFNREGKVQTKIPTTQTFLEIIDSLNKDSFMLLIEQKRLSKWFLVHSEFAMAEIAKKIEKEPSTFEHKIQTLKKALKTELYRETKGSIVMYSRRFPLEEWTIGKIGGGSIGGKARGLSFFNRLLTEENPFCDLHDIQIFIPQSIIVGTNVFDDFIRLNHLENMYDSNLPDRQVARIFLQSDIPPTIIGDLRTLAQQFTDPLVIRSSSLLEDSLYHPFAGIYTTKMIPNNESSFDLRFSQLCNAIKLVYASVFSKQARTYMESTNHIAEDEKMAVIIQKVVGSRKHTSFYPEASGVIRSYNYYPFDQAQPEDGIMHLAMGLGKAIVDGETSLQFSPKYLHKIPQLSNTETALQTTQKKFWSINLKPYTRSFTIDEDEFMDLNPVNMGLKEGSLEGIASTYVAQEDRIYDTIHRQGPKIISFHQLLKARQSSFGTCIQKLLQICEEAMATPVEIECALEISQKWDFIRLGFLQVRPMMKYENSCTIEAQEMNPETTICYTDNALGNGLIGSMSHLVVVNPSTFDLSKTRTIVQEIAEINTYFADLQEQYVLMGPGRWGSSDPWLGIPVQWHHISRIKTFVEYDLPTLHIDPSQGSHFFQNITSLHIGYFTVNQSKPNHFINWEWIKQQKPKIVKQFVSVYQFPASFTVKVDGKKSRGIITKPDLEGALNG
ncbi:MAG: PEP/pyruvate-binding domain-containing protein [Caldisericia bacterium]|nr:PEP/pyruvate-binding domain-containing protein [Caldisericia bacterium]MDD4614325.1 PEP/pyruvate-binding domain-containing protein [Caldisericia bacterium]